MKCPNCGNEEEFNRKDYLWGYSDCSLSFRDGEFFDSIYDTLPGDLNYREGKIRCAECNHEVKE